MDNPHGFVGPLPSSPGLSGRLESPPLKIPEALALIHVMKGAARVIRVMTQHWGGDNNAIYMY